MQSSITEQRALLGAYRQLVNHTLPARFTHPVRHNHCFARIVLDWLFGDCWYGHLSKAGPAYKQLSTEQLRAAVNRMNAWLLEPQLLEADNIASLRYRKDRGTLSKTGCGNG